jgi:hypothetical protein
MAISGMAFGFHYGGTEWRRFGKKKSLRIEQEIEKTF